MGDSSKIEWTEATWNVAIGCSRVSKGCEHCYAEGTARRNERMKVPGYEPGLVRISAKGKPQWTGLVRFLSERLALPLRWRRPRRIFVNSMSDLFHASISFEQIAVVFAVMGACFQHTFQVLTKRPERAVEFFRWFEDGGERRGWGGESLPDLVRRHLPEADRHLMGCGSAFALDDEWPVPNVWLGVSVEDQTTADARIPRLLECPAAVRWVSYEPALGPVDFAPWLGAVEVCEQCGERVRYWNDGPPPCDGNAACGCTAESPEPCARVAERLDWIVVGGESGDHARPFDLDWARATVDACRATGVRCFVKQLGAAPIVSDLTHVQGAATLLPDASGYAIKLRHRKGANPDEWRPDLRVREYPEVRGG